MKENQNLIRYPFKCNLMRKTFGIIIGENYIEIMCDGCPFSKAMGEKCKLLIGYNSLEWIYPKSYPLS